MVRKDDRPTHLTDFGFPPRRVFFYSMLEADVTAEEIRAGDLQPWVDVHLAFGPMVILKERSVTVVKREETVGHPRLAGELGGLVRKPECILAEPDRSAFAGHPEKLAGAHAQEQHRDGSERRRTRGKRPLRPFPLTEHLPPEANGRGPFGEVPRRHRAHHGRKLMAIPRRLQAQEAKSCIKEQPKWAQPPRDAGAGSSADTSSLAGLAFELFARELFLPRPGFFVSALAGAEGAACVPGSSGLRSDIATCHPSGIRKLRPPTNIVSK